MQSSCTPRPMYTGAPMFTPPSAGPMMGHPHHHDPHGFCHSCCQPRSHCLCGRRDCRKEARELVVNSDDTAIQPAAGSVSQSSLGLLKAKADILTNPAGTHEVVGTIERQLVSGTAFIGGGCCVHLSVEYMANNPAKPGGVEIMVEDSEGTHLGWARLEPAGTPYRIKEGIVTTKPGAKLTVTVMNATARVRWCEIFSC